MTIDDLIAALDVEADRALPPAALRLFGPNRTPPPSPDQVEAFEIEIGAALPDEYRRFLLRCNGGNLDWYQFDGLTPDGQSWSAVVSHVGGLRDEPRVSLRSARAGYQGYELQIPRALMWIMGDPGGNGICLGLTGEHWGRVYFWIHDEGPDPSTWDGEIGTAGNIILLANSFTDFVDGLHAREE